ncbi:Kinase family protein [Quillaja saponaria]|uniref:Kinase family protein n=1 Tax=Quillaja saponaria TaxID=32244 RepID=A0AAD7LWT2_QUISA|nr:Kinase family protein [Quillaja saponaria]
MGYLSCNAESAIAICDSYYSDLKNKNRTRNGKPNQQNKLVKIREFQYSDLVAATSGFSADSFLGKGSHGSVYKASLDDGKLVAAVKRTKFTKPSITNFRNHHPTNCTGCTNCHSPAENEIEILSRVRNPRRLVNLIGFCTDSNDNKLIVVEYMPNGTLYDLFHSTTRPPGWTRRVRLALQVAKAVQVLHSSNPPVIHRDIKSSNVLIDENRNARLGDFGLALRGHVEDVRVKCTPPAGTLGYLDPCYLAPGDLSTKSDVFSYGILLLEIISGRNAIDVNYSPPSVVDWALAVLAARCVRSTAEKRPSMLEVVECLKIARKRVQAPPIWNSLRRRVGRVENWEPLIRWEVYDRSEEVVRAVKVGSRRNRKVSSVSVVDYADRSEPIRTKPNSNSNSNPNPVVRSKSIGSGREINNYKVGPESNVGGGNGNQFGFVRRKGGVAVKMQMARLSKSRSMGVLQSHRVLHNYDKNNANGKLQYHSLSGG